MAKTSVPRLLEQQARDVAAKGGGIRELEEAVVERGKRRQADYAEALLEVLFDEDKRGRWGNLVPQDVKAGPGAFVSGPRVGEDTFLQEALFLALTDIIKAHPRYLKPLMRGACLRSFSFNEWAMWSKVIETGEGSEAVDACLACLQLDPACVPPELIGPDGQPRGKAVEVVAVSARRLGQLGDPRAIEPLRDAASGKDTTAEVREAAIDGLRGLRVPGPFGPRKQLP